MINGVAMVVKAAHMRLCHSRMPFVRVYPPAKARRSFSTPIPARFAYFKGACTRGIYDNMKTAVETGSSGKERQFNRRFADVQPLSGGASGVHAGVGLGEGAG